jgi:hypothetical protein
MNLTLEQKTELAAYEAAGYKVYTMAAPVSTVLVVPPGHFEFYREQNAIFTEVIYVENS